MSCEEIDLYGAATNPIRVGFGDTLPLIMDLVDANGDTILTNTAVLKLHIYKFNGVEVTTLTGTVDIVDETVTFTFTAPFWAKLSASQDYDYKMILTDGALVKTVLAAKFIIC
jgi:hypothetical protein